MTFIVEKPVERYHLYYDFILMNSRFSGHHLLPGDVLKKNIRKYNMTDTFEYNLK
jgi:hypothetical protein